MAEKKYETKKDFSNDFVGFEVLKITNDPMKGQKMTFSLASLTEDHTVTASVYVLYKGSIMKSGNVGLVDYPKKEDISPEAKPKAEKITNRTAITINEPGDYTVKATLFVYEGKTHRGKDKEPVWKSSEMVIPVEFKESEMTIGSMQESISQNAVRHAPKKIQPRSKIEKGGRDGDSEEWIR